LAIGICGLFTQGCGDQFRIQLVGDFLELAPGQTKYKAVPVVVRLARAGSVIAAGFDYRVVTVDKDAVGSRPDLARNPGTQGPEKLGQNSRLAGVSLRPLGRVGKGPTEIVGHGFYKRLGVALR
jgi:hypothetical protein